jgi:hypothetical protein
MYTLSVKRMIVARRRVCILFGLVSIKKNDEAMAWFWFASWPVIRETCETLSVKRIIVVRRACILFYFIGEHHHCQLERGKGNIQ